MAGFDVSPTAAQLPFTLEEVDALLGADVRAVFRDPTAARTLLSRLRVTVTTHAEELRTVRRDLARLSEDRKMKASPLSAAVEALARLSADDQGQVFTVHAAGLLESLRDQLVTARQAQLAADSSANRVRLVVGHMLADHDLPAEVRVRLAEHLARVPQPLPPAAEAPAAMPQLPGSPVTVPPADDGLGSLFT